MKQFVLYLEALEFIEFMWMLVREEFLFYLFFIYLFIYFIY